MTIPAPTVGLTQHRHPYALWVSISTGWKIGRAPSDCPPGVQTDDDPGFYDPAHPTPSIRAARLLTTETYG
jgi:hypothetical protein